MNILPKKRWHVKNKDNAARVEHDEAKQRKKLKDESIRSLIATQESRVNYLRRKCRETVTNNNFAIGTKETIRLFADVEEKRTLISCNIEYEDEKKKEKEQHEKKLGILKYLGETADETPAWWSLVPERRKHQTEKRKANRAISDEVDCKKKMKFDPLYHMKKVESDFSRIRETKELLHAKERAAAAQMMSVCASFFPNDIKTPQKPSWRPEPSVVESHNKIQSWQVVPCATVLGEGEEEKQKKLEKLRAARLAREHTERERAAVVLCRSLGLSAAMQAKLESLEEAEDRRHEDERRLPYNSAFNPELSNLAKERRAAYHLDKVVKGQRRHF